jgi:hypothetical protein
MQTPYFPALRASLAALGRRTTRSLRLVSLPELAKCLETYLPAFLLSSQDEGANSRERIFTVRLTLQAFLWQMLKPKTACREVVRQVQAWFSLLGLGLVESGSSAYCQARLRLPRQRLEQALPHLAKHADQQAAAQGCLRGRIVKVVDATGCQLADTSKNQKRYPQSAHQNKGCGFPAMKLLALFSLASGAVLQVVMGNSRKHELRLFRQLWDTLKTGDIILGDRIFGDYATLAALSGRQIDVVARMNVKRRVDFRKSKRLGHNDGLFTWFKSAKRPAYLTPAQWAKLPASLTVRIIRFRISTKSSRTRSITLVTSLLNTELYPLAELAALYARRWHLELWFRNLKTQMGMELLRCKTPDMAEKEVLAYLVAHNLVRCVMAEAALARQVELERLSFKGAIDALRQFTRAMAQATSQKKRNQLWHDLLRILAEDQVPWRPGRREPRALKRRPKPFPFLTKPRHRFKDHVLYRKWVRLQKGAKNRALI